MCVLILVHTSRSMPMQAVEVGTTFFFCVVCMCLCVTNWVRGWPLVVVNFPTACRMKPLACSRTSHTMCHYYWLLMALCGCYLKHHLHFRTSRSSILIWSFLYDITANVSSLSSSNTNTNTAISTLHHFWALHSEYVYISGLLGKENYWSHPQHSIIK